MALRQRGERRTPLVWLAALVAVLGCGIWGFLSLDPRMQVVDAVYRTLRLFVVELDTPAGKTPPPQLWVAAFVAPLLTLRGIAQLFRERLDGVLTRYLVRPELVVFGANERSAALLADRDECPPQPGRWRRAVVVVDPDPAALATVAMPRVHRVRGDGASAASLRRAAVHRARYVVVVTGDNIRNSAVATAVPQLDRFADLEVYVEVEEPGLARTLEQGGHRAKLRTIPFSAAVLGASALLDEVEEAHRAAGRPLLDPDGAGAAPALALFGTGDLVDAVVLELHRRRQVQLLEDPAAAAVPRVALFGPDAVDRRRSLATLVGTDLQLLDIDAYDADLDQVVELDVETARHLARSRPLRQVFVLTPSDLDGGGIAITLARHLGRSGRITLATATGSSPFGDEIAQQTKVSASLAEVRLFRVPQRAYSLPALQAERVADRLGRALWETDRTDPQRTWATVPAADRNRYRAEAADRLQATGTVDELRRSALVAPRTAEVPLLLALGFDRPVALARAGLGVDFDSVPVLDLAGRKLLAEAHPAAFGVWCELARLVADPQEIARRTPTVPSGQDVRSGPDARSGQDVRSGQDLRDVQDLLRIRRAALGDVDARMTLGAGTDAGDVTILVLGGPDEDRDTVLPLLQPTLDGLPPTTVTYALMPRSPLRDALARAGARVLDGPTRRQALDAWAALVAGGRKPAAVRVLALPGADPADLLLARALGVTLGRLELTGAADLSLVLLGGAVGILPLPPDRMTVRAFLRPAQWPDDLADLREPLAAELHRRYVARQRRIKAPDDPVLQPWPALSPWIRRSNLAVVDDIPTKLTMAGLRLAGPDETGPGLPVGDVRARLDQQLELLAEQEHGRFTAERLLSGWTGGVRDPARFLSPHLVAWGELDEQAKGYDRHVIADIPGVLADRGIRVVPASTAVHPAPAAAPAAGSDLPVRGTGAQPASPPVG